MLVFELVYSNRDISLQKVALYWVENLLLL